MSQRWLAPSADQCRHGERAGKGRGQTGVRRDVGGQAEGRGWAGGQVQADLLKEHEA